MQSSKKPTARQRRFHDWIKRQPCVATNEHGPELHHCVGSTAKHNKIEIGQWWCIGLSSEAHRGRHGIHYDGTLLTLHETRKEVEKRLFEKTAVQYAAEGNESLPHEVLDAIRDYHI